MASIDQRPNGHYRARWREYPGGPQKTRQFERKGEAEKFIDGIRGDLVRGCYVDPAGGKILFKVFAESWRKIQSHRTSTKAQVESYLRLHAHPTLGKRALGSVRPSEIQALITQKSETMAPGSVELVYRWISAVFKAAVNDRLIASSPCVNVTLPKKDRSRIDPLTVEQVEALTDAVPAKYRALITFGAGMGFRQGECFGLSLDRIDILHRQVRVDRQLISVSAGVPAFGVPKSKAGLRTVPIPEMVKAALAAHIAQHGVGVEGLVFTNTLGKPLRRSTFGDMWHRAAEKAGLPAWATFHDLRHFYASLLIAEGCSVKTVQMRLGHESAMQTLDTYGHLWPDSDDETRNAVDNVFSGLRSVG
ncbi:MAG: tyrosine-type recombinase/integrase [Acidimicrobiales bacterium]